MFKKETRPSFSAVSLCYKKKRVHIFLRIDREISQKVLGKKQPGHHAPMNAAQFDPKRQDMATFGKMIPQDNIWWAVARSSRAVWPRVFSLNRIGARSLEYGAQIHPKIKSSAKSP